MSTSNTDFVKQFSYAHLDTRLKRISDHMSHSLRAMYRDMGIDTEPNWFLVLRMVEEQPQVSVMEIAARLRFTHQSVITMTNKMVAKGYLERQKDDIDKRKTIFRLTSKAEEKLPLFNKISEVGKEVMYELLNRDTELMKHLEILENNLEKGSFGERIAQQLNNEQS